MNKPSVSELRIQRIIEHLASSPRNGVDNPHRHAAVSRWISSEFDQIGLDVNRQVFNIPGQKPERMGADVSGSLPNSASVSTPNSIIIGARYDTVSGSPGADDNASGIAALLECARVLKESKIITLITFVAFDAEAAQPHSRGVPVSTHFVSNLQMEKFPF